MPTDEEIFAKWRQKVVDEGIASVRAEAAVLRAGTGDRAAYIAPAVIAEYEEGQSLGRHEEQMRHIDSGNTIQKWILAALIVFPIVTIIVTIFLARGAELS